MTITEDRQMTKTYLATMHSEHYFFQSIASAEAAAKEALARGWRKHLTGLIGEVSGCDQEWYDNSRKTVEELDSWYGINITALEMNDCARDHEALNTH